jgi:hypothetical protein
MPAFRLFDPWAALNDAAAAARAAKVAKPDEKRPTTLAELAALADSSVDPPFSPPEPSIPRPSNCVLTTWSEVQEERAAIVEHDGCITVERRAVVRWINNHFATSPIGQCAPLRAPGRFIRHAIRRRRPRQRIRLMLARLASSAGSPGARRPSTRQAPALK